MCSKKTNSVSPFFFCTTCSVKKYPVTYTVLLLKKKITIKIHFDKLLNDSINFNKDVPATLKTCVFLPNIKKIPLQQKETLKYKNGQNRSTTPN